MNAKPLDLGRLKVRPLEERDSLTRVEEILLDPMYVLPTQSNIKEIVITKEMVERKAPVFEIVDSRREEAA